MNAMTIKKSILFLSVLFFCASLITAEKKESIAILPQKEHHVCIRGKFVKTPENANLLQPHCKRLVSQDQFLKSSSGTIFYGNVIYAGSWNELGDYDIVPYGIYSFETIPNFVLTSVFEDEDYLDAKAGVFAYGKYYSFVERTLGGDFYGVRVYQLDIDTWKSQNGMQGLIDYEDYSGLPVSMTYDVKDNLVYAIVHNADASGFIWASMSEDGEFTKIDDWQDADNTMVALACDRDGVIYGIAEDGNLYTIDKSNGRPVLIGATGQQPAFLQSAAFDYRSGKIIWAATLSTQETKLFEVDVKTGIAKLVGSMPDNEQIVGLYCISPQIDPNAPSTVTDLSVSFVKDALEGTISFKVPELTYGGSALSDVVTIKVLIDDQEVFSATKNPGELCIQNHLFTAGVHKVSVIARNSIGEGESVTIDTFAGVDLPDAVTNLSLTVSPAGLATLSWGIPDKGINGGYIDTSDLKYKIERYPSDITVHDSYTQTSYVEQLPDILAGYSYKVTALYGEMEGGSAISNKVIYGTACEIPYSENFEREDALELFTIVDNNKDQSTWVWEKGLSNSYVQYKYNKTNHADDWLMMPALKLKKELMYKLSYKVKASSSYNVEKIKVTLGTSVNPSTHTKVLMDIQEIKNISFETREVVFGVKEDGNYIIGLQACSEANKLSLGLDDIEVETVGLSGIPSSISDLEILPDPNDELVATIKFTAPSVDFAGNALASLARIDIYKGSDKTDLLHSIENPFPGHAYSWKDFSPERGMNTYTVYAVNEIGESDAVSTSAFIGCYQPPYIESFDDSDVLNEYTIIDANKDDNTWSYVDGEMRYKYKGSNSGDDWLITPAVKMKPGSYVLSFKTKVQNPKYPETLKVTMGLKPTVETQTIILMESKKMENSEYETIRIKFVIGTAGKYNFGFQACSDPKMFQFFIDDIKIDYNTDKMVPYYEDFEGITEVDDAPAGWCYTRNVDAGCGFGAFPSVKARSGSFYFYSEPQQAIRDTWAFSPGVQLTAGISYNIAIYANVPGYGDKKDEFKITVGRDATAEAQTTVLIDKSGDKAEKIIRWTRQSAIFVPSESGFYYFGINHCTKAVDVNGVCFDDFSVVEVGKEKPVVKTYMTGGLWSAGLENKVYLANGIKLNFAFEDIYADTYEWNCQGGVPATSTESEYTVSFNRNGAYDVILSATKDGTTETVTHSFDVILGKAGVSDIITNIKNEEITAVPIDRNEYVSGGNSYYSAIAEKYTLSPDMKGTINEIDLKVMLYKADVANKKQEAFILICSEEDNGMPGDTLCVYRTTVEELFGSSPISGETILKITLPSPVEVFGNFFVVLDIPTFYPSGKSFYAIASTYERGYDDCTAYAFYEKNWVAMNEIFVNGNYSFALMPHFTFMESEVSINGQKDNKISIYPTVVSKHVIIESAAAAQIIVTNVSGCVLLRKVADSERCILDMNGFTSGMYFITIVMDGERCTTRIIKE